MKLKLESRQRKSSLRRLSAGFVQELAPLNIIRTETVLSRLPIHNLAKKGTINIRIVKKNEHGQVELLWNVSPSRDYGEPRQLAYKLDTIIINRKIDEQKRPLPELIRLGSLHEVAKDLNLGGDTSTVKRALLQNASAFITAKLNYKANDGSDCRLEAGFTRYTIILTGERLPGGNKADAVYIELHPRYREVLNNAPIRPLNYDYLRELAPAAQRFYEIVSRYIFVTFKHHREEARLSYSEYCTFSAQQRYDDWEHVRKQMYKVHRPHLESGYLKAVRSECTKDSEGRPDWNFYYKPGPKARAEYHAFTKRLPLSLPADDPEAGAEEISAPTPAAQAQSVGAGAGNLGAPAVPVQSAPAAEEQPVMGIDPGLAAQLTRRGILESRARKLLENLAKGQEVIDQLEWGDYLIAQTPPRTFRNPPGFYISLIRDNVIPPGTFENSRQRALREERERAHELWLFEEQQLRFDYNRYREDEKERYIREDLSQDRYQELFQTKRQQFKRQYPQLPEQTITDMAHGAIRGEMEPHMTFLGFEEWRNQRPQPPSAAQAQTPPAMPGQGSGE